MIVRPQQHWLRRIFVWHGSVLSKISSRLLLPFGTENNDLPLDAICNAIEIDLLQMNDEAEIPAKILPDRHYQLT